MLGLASYLNHILLYFFLTTNKPPLMLNLDRCFTQIIDHNFKLIFLPKLVLIIIFGYFSWIGVGYL